MSLQPAFGVLPEAAFLALMSLAQATVVLVLALLLIRTVARHSPAARHGIGLCALACVLCTPAIAVPSGWPEAVPNLPSFQASNLATNRQAHLPAQVALAVWAAGAALLALRFLRGCKSAGILRRSARQIDAQRLAPVLAEVREVLGLTRLPGIAASPLTAAPVVLGPFRPLVLLPEEFAASLDGPQLRDVLVHECAHVAERHHRAGLLQRLAVILFWPHPLIHQLDRELTRAREEVCDNFVLRRAAAPAYARTLLRVAAGVGELEEKAGSGGLRRRVHGLLDGRRERLTAWARWKTVAVTAAFLAAGISVTGTRVTQADVPARPAAAPNLIQPARAKPGRTQRTGRTQRRETGKNSALRRYYHSPLTTHQPEQRQGAH